MEIYDILSYDFITRIMEATDITEEQIREFKNAFMSFDKNGDGRIDAEELGIVMRSIGLHPKDEELKAMIKQADKDGSGDIDLPEFIELMASKSKNDTTESDLREAFSLFDKDGNGLISAQEMKFVFTCMGFNITEKEAVELVKQADMDGDGHINYEVLDCIFVTSSIILFLLTLEFKNAFMSFDKNVDQRIDAEELEIVTRSIGLHPKDEELKAMIKQADKDGSGDIDLPEFIELMASKSKNDTTESDLREAFSLFDKDGNGLISAQEMKFVLTCMGFNITEKEAVELVKQADIDGDGHINYEEFIRTMKG
ncbi:calmodulin-related protein [Nematostella vectensis]|uniref:calmodulin-related protein n=1 Tax=Nematostella vectensis TaxID=45351 RepID=UPI002076D817|nr:calmodulin-related protein [Nematostella vectensis]